MGHQYQKGAPHTWACRGSCLVSDSVIPGLQLVWSHTCKAVLMSGLIGKRGKRRSGETGRCGGKQGSRGAVMRHHGSLRGLKEA